MIQLLAAFVATSGFVFLMNAPLSEIPICGLVGVLSWGIFLLISTVDPDGFAAIFGASLASVFVCRVLAPIRRMPRTVYLVAAIIPLVPGMHLYNMMLAILMDDTNASSHHGTRTLIFTGIISISILIVLSLPEKLIVFLAKTFKMFERKEKSV